MMIELVSGHRNDDGDSLIESLRSDPDLRTVELAPILNRHGGDGMGGVVDGLIAVFGAGGIAVAIVQAVSAWLGARRSEVTVKVTMDGKTIEYSLKTHRDPSEIIHLLESGPKRDGNEAA
jgi:hypothetical protein